MRELAQGHGKAMKQRWITRTLVAIVLAAVASWFWIETSSISSLPPGRKGPTQLQRIEQHWRGASLVFVFVVGFYLGERLLHDHLLKKQRLKTGLCPACAYPIGTSPVCTECGVCVESRAKLKV
jgi:hypothetical protein